ncbi:MAG: tetratricopeptide repeat protein [Steroidobacteraceae bacterium]
MAALLVGSLTMTSPVQAEEKITTKEVGKAMQAAQEAVSKKQWDKAVASLKEAQAVQKKTPFEAFKIDEFLGFVYIQQKNYSEAAPVFERMVNSGMLPPDQQDARLKAVAQLYFQLQQYSKAVDYAKRWLKNHHGEQEISVLVGQGYYLMKDYKNAITAMDSVITASEKAGQPPKENWLQIVLSSYHNLNDDNGLANTMQRVVRYYPTPENWDKLLTVVRQKEQPDRAKRNVYRLMLDVGALKEGRHFVDAAEISMDLGLPGEALRFLEAGFANKALENEDKARNERLLANAKKQVAVDKAALGQLAKEAQGAPTGQGYVALGQAYLSYAQFDEAIGALQSGIKKGSLTDSDEAQVNLGIAYLKKNQLSEARDALKSVKDGSKWTEVANLWLLRANARPS